MSKGRINSGPTLLLTCDYYRVIDLGSIIRYDPEKRKGPLRRHNLVEVEYHHENQRKAKNCVD